MADPQNPPMIAAKLQAIIPPRYEYEILRAKARTDANNVVTGVVGIEDATITRMAREGWRVQSSSWSGRKLLAVILERPVQRKDRKRKSKPKGERKAAPPPIGDNFGG